MIHAYTFCINNNLSFWHLRQAILRRKLIKDIDYEIKYCISNKSIMLTESGQKKAKELCKKGQKRHTLKVGG